MFNSLASYLLGTTTTPAATAADVVDPIPETSDSTLSTMRIASIVPLSDLDDDDWVLIDRNGSAGETDIETSLESLSEHNDDIDDDIDLTSHLMTRTSSTSSILHLQMHNYQQQPPQRSSSCSSLPSLCATPSSSSSIDESWYITPPPCFTSAGPVHMETSPLENLLIEHPSMSVYQHSTSSTHYLYNTRHRHNSAPGSSSSASSATRTVADELLMDLVHNISNNSNNSSIRPDSSATIQTARANSGSSGNVNPTAASALRGTRNRRLTNVANSARQQPNATTNNRPIVSNNHSSLRQQQERQCLNVRSAQKVKIQKACQTLKKNYIERNNKAREVNFRNRRQRRGERSQGALRSNANNNRKCC